MPRNEFSCDCHSIHHGVIDEVRGAMLSDEGFLAATDFLKAIGDMTRFKILWAVSKSEMCVCDIANLLSMTKSAVSHQLGYLRRAGLVRFRKEGKIVYYSPADELVEHILAEAVRHVQLLRMGAGEE